MKIKPTSISGVYTIAANGFTDERGGFARLFCPVEFADAEIDFHPLQTSISTNTNKHTLRGLHFQLPPREETKLLTVIKGEIFDVAVDLRPESPSHRKWVGMHLSGEKLDGALIPAGVAHGYITTQPDTVIVYHIDSIYEPGFGCGIRWDDPAIGIKWPAAPAIISQQDKNWKLLAP